MLFFNREGKYSVRAFKEEFEKVERENYKFRTYLKNHADSDELDEQFLELHNELFKVYDCSKCRSSCCANHRAYAGALDS